MSPLRRLWRWIVNRGTRRVVAKGLREIVEAHRTAKPGDAHYQMSCEAAYCGLDDCLIYLAARLEGWPRDVA